MGISQMRRGFPIIGAAVFIVLPAIAFSHVEGSSRADSPYAWNFTLEGMLGIAIGAALYANGLRVLAGRSHAQGQRWRHISYFGGLAYQHAAK